MGDTAMQILQEHEVRMLVKAYQERYITAEEFREELEWYWDRRVYKGTKPPLLLTREGHASAIPRGDGIARRIP
jgi:hypothetical protein